MTKFHGPFRTDTVFSTVMTSRDRETFRLAFTKGVPKKNKEGKNIGEDFHQLATARRWVNEVIRLWADKIDINHGLAFQVICSGGVDVVRRNFQRRLEAHQGSLKDLYARKDKMSDAQWSYARDQYHKTEAALKQVTEMDHQALVDLLRGAWVFCLSIRHPSVKVNDFSGFAKATGDGQKTVGQDANPKPRSAPNKAKSIPVEHRTITPREPAEMAS